MKPSAWAAVFLFSILILFLLTSGCTTETDVSSEKPDITTTVPTSPTVIKTVVTQKTEIIPPARPSRYPPDAIGKYAGYNQYSGTGDGVTGLRFEHNAYYHFIVTGTDGKPLKLYITNWNGDKTVEIYDSSKGVSVHKTIELPKGYYYVWAIAEGPYTFQVGYEP